MAVYWGQYGVVYYTLNALGRVRVWVRNFFLLLFFKFFFRRVSINNDY